MPVDFKAEMAFGGRYGDSHTRTNLCGQPEPSASANNQWFVNAGGGSVNAAYYNDATVPGAPSIREVTWATAATAISSGQYWISGVGAVAPGDLVTARYKVRVSKDQTLLTLLYFYDAAGAFISSAPGTPYTAKAGKWVDVVSVTGTAPANASRVLVGSYATTGGTLWQVGDKHAMTQMLIEKSSSVGPYFYGPTITLPGPADGSWVDISDTVKGFGSQTGRNNEFDEVEAGTLSLKLDNNDGRYTPERVPSILDKNLVTNPRFASAGSPFPYRTNLATNPSNEAAGGWLSNNGTSWTASDDSTFAFVGTKSRKSTPVNVGQSVTLLSMYNVGGGTFAVSPGDVITASVYGAHNASVAGTLSVNYTFLDSGGAVVTAATSGGNVNMPAANTWYRASVTSIAAPSTAATVRIGAVINRSTGVNVAGDVAWVDACLVEKAGAVFSYFDGDSTPNATAVAEGFTYAWSGTAHASASYLQLPYQSSVGPFSHYTSVSQGSGRVYTQGEYRQRAIYRIAQNPGAIVGFSTGSDAATYHARVNPGDNAGLRFQMRTLSGVTLQVLPRLGFYNSATANVGLTVGPAVAVPSDGSWVDVVVPGSVAPAGTTTARFLIYSNGTWAAGTEVEFRNALIDVGSNAPLPYFDGTSPFAAWSGTADASTSVQWEANYYPNIQPQTPVRVRYSVDGWQSHGYVFTGMVEKWPVTLDNLASCDVTVTDTFGFLAGSKAKQPIRERFRTAGAARYFPLAADTGFSDTVGSIPGASFFGQSGGAVSFEGDPFYRGDGVGSGLTVPATTSTAGCGLSFSQVDDGTDAGTVVALWQPDNRATLNNGPTQDLIRVVMPDGRRTGLQLWADINNGNVMKFRIGVSVIPGSTLDTYLPVAGAPVWLMFSWQGISGTQIRYTVSVLPLGGSTVYTVTNTYSRVNWSPPGTAPAGRQGPYKVFVGGSDVADNMFSGQMANAAYFATPPTLTTLDGGAVVDEVGVINAALSAAGASAFALSGTGVTSQAPPHWEAGASLLEIGRAAASDANGLLYPTPDGRLAYLRGKDQVAAFASGGIRLTDTEAFEPGMSVFVDVQNIVNDVTVSLPSSGGLAGASTNVVNASSVSKFGQIAASFDVGLTDEAQRASLAGWLAYTRGTSGLRIESVTFDLACAAVPDSLLSVDIGDRIRLAMPAAAPFPEGDFVVEGIDIDADAVGGIAESSITFKLSMTKNRQAWVLGDSTFGVLGSTTRPFTG